MLSIDELRSTLYLPLGVIATSAFALRLLWQWLASERRRERTVPTGFWVLSLLGNSLLWLHYVVQVQFPFALVQSINAAGATRNLAKKAGFADFWVISAKKCLFFAIFLSTLTFLLQGWLLIGSLDWVRSPPSPLNGYSQVHHHLGWHVLGACAQALFASRFWVQWWIMERKGSSDLPNSFWVMTILGASLSSLYCFVIGDLISLSPLFTLVPAIRNLMIPVKMVQREEGSYAAADSS